MKKIFAILTTACAIACAGPHEKDIYDGYALGIKQAEYKVEAAEGVLHIDVISNSEYQIVTDALWLQVPSKGSGREGFDLSFDENNGFARVAAICISGQTMTDTIYVRQRAAIAPDVTFDGRQVISVDGSSGGHLTVALVTNLGDGDIVVKPFCHDGEEQWLSGFSLENAVLEFDYSSNDQSHFRTAHVRLYYLDEFGEETFATIYVSQKNSDDEAIAITPFEELRALAEADPVVLEDDIFIEGVVVSNTESGNMGDNTQLSQIRLDYSVSERTVYLQSLDQRYGFMLITDEKEDNVFKQFDRVRLSLRGATLYKSVVNDPASDPTYYWLEGIISAHVFMVEAGEEIQPKEKYISELNDEDIFTYVALKDCELPFRKGSLTPINELFTNASAVHKVNKFAVSLHDIQGSSIYIYTNTTCPYRRDGIRLPQGSGKMKGIVVHERYTRFLYEDNASGDEDTYGNIGRYQIRHTCREDFAMAPERSDNDFSSILAEWRYIEAQSQMQYFATDGDRTAFFAHSRPDENDGKIKFADDFSYLGPIGTESDGFFGENPGNLNGLGVILEDGTDWMGPSYVGLNSNYAEIVNNISSAPGSGISPSGIGAAWYTDINWNTSSRQPEGLILNFSTESVHASRMSLHIAMMSIIAKNGITGPRDFNVDYSFDKIVWRSVDRFRISDYAGASGVPVTQLWQTPGYIPVTVELPAAELSGRSEVYLRIFPDKSMKVGSYTDYMTSTVPNNSYPRTAYNYIGIRYNK